MKNPILEWIDTIELEGLDEEVGETLVSSGAVTEEEWKDLSDVEKVELVENLEVYEWQDYYIGFYSALEMLRRFTIKQK